MTDPLHMNRHLMDIEIDIAKMTDEDTPLDIEFGGFGEEFRMSIGPLRVLMNYTQIERLYGQIKPYFTRCPHERLDEDGICRSCGADRRGI